MIIEIIVLRNWKVLLRLIAIMSLYLAISPHWNWLLSLVSLEVTRNLIMLEPVILLSNLSCTGKECTIDWALCHDVDQSLGTMKMHILDIGQTVDRGRCIGGRLQR